MEGALGPRGMMRMLVTRYGQPRDGAARSRPPACLGAHTRDIHCALEPAHISTSDAERQHLTMRLAGCGGLPGKSGLTSVPGARSNRQTAGDMLNPKSPTTGVSPAQRAGLILHQR